MYHFQINQIFPYNWLQLKHYLLLNDYISSNYIILFDRELRFAGDPRNSFAVRKFFSDSLNFQSISSCSQVGSFHINKTNCIILRQVQTCLQNRIKSYHLRTSFYMFSESYQIASYYSKSSPEFQEHQQNLHFQEQFKDSGVFASDLAFKSFESCQLQKQPKHIMKTPKYGIMDLDTRKSLDN